MDDTNTKQDAAIMVSRMVAVSGFYGKALTAGEAATAHSAHLAIRAPAGAAAQRHRQSTRRVRAYLWAGQYITDGSGAGCQATV